MSLLDLIPAPYRIAAELGIVVVAVTAVGAALHHYGAVHEAEGEARVQAKWDASIRAQQAQAILDAAANAKETQRRLKEQEDAQHAHDQELAAAHADADAARTAVERLRQRATAVASVPRGTASNAAPGGNSQAAGATAAMLADLLGRVADHARLIAAYADDSRAAGLQCERSYSALMVH